MARLGRFAYMLPLLGALVVCAFVLSELSVSYAETKTGQKRLQLCSRLRDGIFDLYQQLNASERFNSSYILTRSPEYLSEYRRSMDATLKSLKAEMAIAEELLPGDLVMANLFRAVRKRVAELDRRIEEYHQLGPASDRQLVLRSPPTQYMGRFRLCHRTANANLREMDNAISGSLVSALERRGFLLILGAVVSALLLSLAFFQLNASLGQSRKLLADVQLAEQRYQLLANRVQDNREEEKARLARRVHDELGQSLTAAKIDLAMALRIAESNPAGVNRQIRRAMESLDSAVRDVRRVSTELRPGILDQMGLEPPLEWMMQEFGQRMAIVVDFQCSPGVSLGDKGDIVVFRIAQEALTNIARHAQASRVTIRGTVDTSWFVLTIRDDGVGFGPEKLNDPHSIGLFGMRDRAEAAGGSTEIHSQVGNGVLVSVRMPIAAESRSVPA
ncbi:MAG: ATP-binding protein [Acidobacteria bacterium]|nr:ATP-binding protein [Acidobacteriota bacterium]